MYTKRNLAIILLSIFLFSCSKNIAEENNGFIINISDDKILFLASDGECKYSIDSPDTISDICRYRIDDNYDITLNSYVSIVVDDKGNVKSINEANDLYQKKYQLKELLNEYERIEINCEGYGNKIDLSLTEDELIEFIDSIGDLTVYKDFYTQHGAGGIGCKLICEKNGINTTINDSGLNLTIGNEEYGYYFSSNETLTSKIIELFK